MNSAESRYRALFAESGSAMILFQKGVVNDCNKAAVRLLGYPREFLLGRTLIELSPPFQPDGQPSNAAMERFHSATSGGLSRFEWNLLEKNGSQVHADVSLIGAGDNACFQAVLGEKSRNEETERELLQHKAMLRQILDSLPQSIFWKDCDCVYLGGNKVFARAGGLTDHELVAGKTDFDFPWRNEAESYRADDQEVLRSKRPKEHIIEPLQQADGSRLWIDTTKVPLCDDKGNVIGVLGVYADITERKRAEAELHRAHAFNDILVDTINALVIVIAPDRKIVRFNRACERLCQWRSEEVVGRDFLTLLIPEDQREGVGEFFGKLSTGMFPVQHENDWLVRDGSRRYISWANSVMLGATGDVEFVVSTGVDLTERKRAEEALRESQERFSRAFRLSPDSININRLSDGVYIEINQGFTRITGYTAEECIGRSSLPGKLGVWVNQADRDRLVEGLKASGVVEGLEVPFRHKDGHIIQGMMSARIIQIRGEPCVLSITRDMSEHKQLEDQLRQAQKMEAVGQLAGGIAHDFNNILASLMLNLDLLQSDSSLKPESMAILVEMEAESKRAANLTRQLLLFSRRQIMLPRPIDINETLNNLLKMLRRLIGEHIKLDFHGASTPLWVEADPGMIDQVIMNLCVNARDAMPNGGKITIIANAVELSAEAARTVAEARPGHFVSLCVADTGCGMEEKVLSHLFEPFFTTKEVGKGTGLGLASVHGIVKQHRGWVTVQSTPGHGSRFCVFLPTTRKASTEAAVQNSRKPEKQLFSETVLLVEDDPMVRRTTAAALRRHGFRILEAGNGREALALWQDCAAGIDLLLTDMVMPEGMTGLELAQKLKASKPSLKVIIMSGYSAEIVDSNILETSGIMYLPKPFDIKTLIFLARDILKGPHPSQTF